MKKIWCLVSFGLAACVTPSPLAPEEQIQIQGYLFDVAGHPAQHQRLHLGLPFFASRQTQTDVTGHYAFEFPAEQTQIARTVAAELDLLAESSQGMSVSQSLKVLKSLTVLPSMYFWNDLLSPPAEQVLPVAQSSVFRWANARNGVRDYTFRLQNAQSGVLWQQTLAETHYTLPERVLEPNTQYTWSVQARFSDYEAQTAQRAVKTADWPFQSLPIQQIQNLAVPQTTYPSWHDGQYRLELADELSYQPGQTVSLRLSLDRRRQVQALHWSGSGFAAELEIRQMPLGPVLARGETQDGHFLLDWKPLETSELYLMLKPVQGGFVRIQELRLIGPATS